MRIARHIGKLEALGLKEGETAYQITLDGTENSDFKQILEGWIDALELHEERSKDYKNRALFSLGLKGEFVGFWRKAQKLHSEVWESSTKLTREGVQEVLMDMMGSVGLLLSEQRKLRDKYAAGWRDNHSNRPTFGVAPVLRADVAADRGDRSWLKEPEGNRVVLGAGTATLGPGKVVPITGAVMWTGPSKTIKAGDRISGQIVEGPTSSTIEGNCNCELNHPGVPHMHG